MRFTGSFHTIVTHGFAVSVISSGVRSGSTSTGLVVAIRPWWHRACPRAARCWLYAAGVRAARGLPTDHYELTMLQAALAPGPAHRRSVFELSPRRLPEGRRYGVV